MMENYTLTPLIEYEQVQNRVKALAEEINMFFKDRNILIIGVLKGSLFFMADLLRELTVQHTFDFVQARSYSGDRSRGRVDILKEPAAEIKGKDILLVEDILDTGLTSSVIKRYFEDRGANKVYLCCLLNKKKLRKADIEADFKGLSIDNKFVVGYGLDHNEKFRELKGIFVFESKT